MYNWSLVYIVCAILLVGVIHYLTRGERKLNYPKLYYYATLASAVFWLIFNFLAVNAINNELAVIFYIMMLASVSVMVTFVSFNVKSFMGEISVKDVIIGLSPLMILFLFSHTIAAVQTKYGWAIEYNIWERVWMFGIIVLMVYVTYLLMKTRSKIKNPQIKSKMDIYSASIIFAFLSAVVLSLACEWLLLPSLSSIGAALFVTMGYFAFKK